MCWLGSEAGARVRRLLLAPAAYTPGGDLGARRRALALVLALEDLLHLTGNVKALAVLRDTEAPQAVRLERPY